MPEDTFYGFMCDIGVDGSYIEKYCYFSEEKKELVKKHFDRTKDSRLSKIGTSITIEKIIDAIYDMDEIFVKELL